jgi:MFS family permease
LARGYIDNPAVFGWVWPVFGAAAAFSTLAAARFGHRLAPWRLWMGAQWVLAAGLLAPVVSLNVVTLLTAAVCVGGTFMVITMAGIKEVLRVAGAQASRGVGMMTAAFAVGQIAGPLSVSLFAGSTNAFTVTSISAALGLVLGNCLLAKKVDLPQSVRWSLRQSSRRSETRVRPSKSVRRPSAISVGIPKIDEGII